LKPAASHQQQINAMLRNLLLISVLAFPFWAEAQTYTPKTIPNTRVSDNLCVTDPDAILSPATAHAIDTLLHSTEKQTTAQVQVVMLKSIGDASEFDFAQELFEHWGIGRAQKDNGLLILYVEDKRVIRFHTGFGLEGILPDATCKRIQMERMVPRFKEGNVDGGMLAGVEEVTKIIRNPAYAAEIRDTSNSETEVDWTPEATIGLGIIIFPAWLIICTITYFVRRKSGFADSENATEVALNLDFRKREWVWLWIVFPAFLILGLAFTGSIWVLAFGFYGYLIFLTFLKRKKLQAHTADYLAKQEYHLLYEHYAAEQWYWVWKAIFFPIPFAFLIFDYRKTRHSFRTMPRPCRTCGEKMERLDEQVDDGFLAKKQVFEEGLKSVDYDVWKCPACANVTVEDYPNKYSKYDACPKCKTLAFHTVSTTTLVAATTSSSGTREVVKGCQFCNHHVTSTETIPRIVSSSSSSGGGGGGSFGGGSSGGGGASSSW
jgi:uncharacterized protein